MPRTVGFTKEQAEAAIRASRSYSEALRRLGLRPAGGNHSTLKKHAERWGISTEHFDPNWATRGLNRGRRKPLDEILVERSTYSRGHLKERLYDEGVKERRCEICGQTEAWRGRRMALILDHINGVADDNRIENLRIVCPNCAATFETHCTRPHGPAPVERDCARCGKPFRVRYARHRYCSQACGTRAPRSSKGASKPGRRKVVRPPLEQVRADIERLGFLATGRKYGVSDNAVRKWLVWYERQEARDADEGDARDEAAAAG